MISKFSVKLPLILLHLTYFQFTKSCVYNDTESLEKKDWAAIYETRQKSLLEKYDFNNDVKRIMLAVHQAAGPFNIANYEGSINWNNEKQGTDWPMSYAQCAGNRQSPIQIDRKQTDSVSFPPLSFISYKNFHPNMTINNNGHTVQIQGPWGRHGNVIPTMSGGPLKGSYQLLNVHFHWGYNSSQGSEHILDSFTGAAEIHFVHFNTKYSDVSAALAADDPESFAVVGIIFKPSIFTTPELKLLMDTLAQAVTGGIIFPALFPLDIIHQKGHYYTYQGSLTNPGCIEKVRWIVMDRMLDINTRNLNVLKKFMYRGIPIQGNYRNVQPINGRKVQRARV